MENLSTRELGAIANVTNDFAVRDDLFAVSGLPTGESLRTRLELLAALLEFAPEVRLHPEDDNRPCSAEFFYQRCQLIFWPFPHPQELVLGNGDIESAADLLGHQRQVPGMGALAGTGADQSSGSGTQTTAFKLDLVGDDARAGDPSFVPGSITSAVPCYCHARKVPDRDGWWDLQYLFCYPFNSMGVLGFGEHEGEWEHVTVRVRLGETPEPIAIYYSAHSGEGGWALHDMAAVDQLIQGVQDVFGPVIDIDRDEMILRHKFDLNARGQPIVYSAKASHASYPGAGEIVRHGIFGVLPNDYTSAAGPIWDCRGRLTYVGERHDPVAQEEWIRFTGRWGIDGPFGPAFQQGGWWKTEEAQAWEALVFFLGSEVEDL